MAALALAAIAVAAPSASAQTRDEYAAQVNPICAEAAKDSERIFGKARFKHPKQIAKTFRRVDRVEEGKITAIEAVRPPPADAALVAAWIESLRRVDELNDKLARLNVRLFRLITPLPEVNPIKLKRLGRRLTRLARRVAREFEEGFAVASQLGATECTGDAPTVTP